MLDDEEAANDHVDAQLLETFTLSGLSGTLGSFEAAARYLPSGLVCRLNKQHPVGHIEDEYASSDMSLR